MGTRKQVVMGSWVKHRSGQTGEVTGLRFSHLAPYSLREVQVRWDDNSGVNWVKAKDVK